MHPNRRSGLLSGFQSLDRIFDVFERLVGEVVQRDVGGHGASFQRGELLSETPPYLHTGARRQPATLIPIGVQRVEELLLSERTCIDTHQLLTGWNDLAGRLQAALFARLASAMSVPSVPMIMRHLSPKSLASGRRTEITWLCQTETRSWMVVPQGLAQRSASGLPLRQPLRRQLPNCRIGRAVGRSPCRTSCGFWRRSIAPPLAAPAQSCVGKVCTRRP